MKRLLLLSAVLTLLIAPASIFAQRRSGSSKSYGGGSVSVRGHVKRDGAYVQPHRRTAPDKSKYNNYGTKGNVNPYTGKKGTKKPS